ncbi:MAG: peptidyl-prolyl cis-trans isomerase [Candidatus Koribacter versatilis]|uniref:Periplasmic chaperone PpiD n=1 Tax=Candidatus Korobacter versatilis TaxID=658062 RepID=A0A932A7G1_9BACT|nr:peptidyl-prolyl cis-trans isomerase [Candidatus Koribacter versatilis]
MIRFLQTPSLAKKVILGGMLLFICVAMVITLIPGTGLDLFGTADANQVGVYANVGDEQVTSAEIQKRAQKEAQQRGVPAQFLGFLVPQVAEQVVSQKALLVEAHRMGLKTTDEELRDELKNGVLSATFYPKGQWIGQDKYDQLLQENGYSIADFERAMKDDLLIRKLQTMVQASATTSDAEVQKEFIKQNVKIKFEYAVLTPDSMSKQINPNEAELRKYYQANLARLKDSIPEQRKVKLALVDASKVAGQATPADAELKRYYDDHREQFRVQDEVNLRHILVKTPPPGLDGKVDQKAVDAARAKAEGLLKQVKGGADFAALAKKDSDDTVSAVNGGSLGWIGKGRTVPEFEQAAFALQKGQTSDLVKSQFGFHIIKIDDKRAAHVQTLAEVKELISPIVAQEKAEKATEALANKVLSAARSEGLDAAAAKSGVNVVTTDFFNQNGVLPGIGQAPEFMTAVFSAKEKSGPAMAKVQQGYAIFQLEAVKPPQTPAFEQVRAQLETQYKQERSTQLLAQKTQELSDRARALHNLKQAAKEVGAEIKTSELVGASSQVPDIGQMANVETAFDLKQGEISSPMQAGRNGVVLQLVERQEPTAAELTARRDEVRETLLRQKRSQAMAIFAAGVKQRMEKDGKIKYNKAEQDRLAKGLAGAAGS